MARNFDGTNDNLTAPDNSSSGLDNNDISLAFWYKKANQPGGTSEIVFLTMTQAGGGGRYIVRAGAPASSGFRLEFVPSFSTTNGLWLTGDVAVNTWTHFAITYNRSLTTNDPIVYVNGTSVSLTESTTPVGTGNTGGDTVRMGENATNASDMEGVLTHVCAIGGTVFSAANVNVARWWGRPIGGLQIYYSLITTKLGNDGSDAAALTATGTTVVADTTPVVRPGSAMLGMGVGW